MSLLDNQKDEPWQLEFDDGFPEYLYSIYRYMTFGLCISGLIAYLCASSSLYKTIATEPFVLPTLLALPLVIVVMMSAQTEKVSIPKAHAYFLIFAILIGFSFAGIFQVYLGDSIAKAFFAIAGAFFILSIVGFFTKRGLTRVGTLLLLSIVGISVLGLINHWYPSTPVDLIISSVGIVIFSSLTAFNTPKIKKRFYTVWPDCQPRNREPILGALSLYLDFMNVLITPLRFINRSI
ncbi:MAG TPA: Bax inhibitor-1/YccA family protein [Aquirhabdus sp.]